jgi:hypothetical protein
LIAALSARSESHFNILHSYDAQRRAPQIRCAPATIVKPRCHERDLLSRQGRDLLKELINAIRKRFEEMAI